MKKNKKTIHLGYLYQSVTLSIVGMFVCAWGGCGGSMWESNQMDSTHYPLRPVPEKAAPQHKSIKTAPGLEPSKQVDSNEGNNSSRVTTQCRMSIVSGGGNGHGQGGVKPQASGHSTSAGCTRSTPPTHTALIRVPVLPLNTEKGVGDNPSITDAQSIPADQDPSNEHQKNENKVETPSPSPPAGVQDSNGAPPPPPLPAVQGSNGAPPPPPLPGVQGSMVNRASVGEGNPVHLAPLAGEDFLTELMKKVRAREQLKPLDQQKRKPQSGNSTSACPEFLQAFLKNVPLVELSRDSVKRRRKAVAGSDSDDSDSDGSGFDFGSDADDSGSSHS